MNNSDELSPAVGQPLHQGLNDFFAQRLVAGAAGGEVGEARLAGGAITLRGQAADRRCPLAVVR